MFRNADECNGTPLATASEAAALRPLAFGKSRRREGQFDSNAGGFRPAEYGKLTANGFLELGRDCPSS
jgi:hypothetical protein